jgi:hypothetical protein
MSKKSTRVAAYVDGFNLYHAIADRQEGHLKWLNLWKLCEGFAPGPDNSLVVVKYCSAFATWLTDPYRRHQVYTSALAGVGVICLMGQFKQKPAQCKRCGAKWTRHEEKETDVAIGVELVRDAFLDFYDRALIITADADIAPALRAVRREFPSKQLQVLTPPGLQRSNELRGAAGRPCREIKWTHIERSLFGPEVRDAGGKLVAIRPAQYDPPPRG